MKGTTLMAKKEKTPQKIFAEQFVAELQPKTVEDVENGLKSIFGPIFESMLKGELSAHLGYESNVEVCGYYGFEKSNDTSNEMCSAFKTPKKPEPEPVPEPEVPENPENPDTDPGNSQSQPSAEQ